MQQFLFLEENNQSYQLAFAHLNKAEALFNLTDQQTNDSVDEASESLNKAVDIIDTNAFTKLKVMSYRIAAMIAIRKGDLVAVEMNMKLFEAKKDSLQQVYLQAISKGIEIDASVNNLTKIISDQQEVVNKQQKSINFGRMTTGLSIALIIILSLLTLSLYKKQQLACESKRVAPG